MGPEQLAGGAVVIATLAVATLFGALWQRGNGRMRDVRPTAAAGTGRRGASRGDRAAPNDGGTGVSEADGGAVEGGAANGGGVTGSGVNASSVDGSEPDGLSLTAEDIGSPLGERATLVQFSTAFCQPCRATRRVLTEVAAMVEGVAHAEIDAESRLDLVRRLGIMRTPTVLVLDARGHVTRRASGQPRKADVIAALGPTIDP
ncbi:Thioredoxin domain-containing protein [Nocardiopsis rhodophaea]